MGAPIDESGDGAGRDAGAGAGVEAGDEIWPESDSNHLLIFVSYVDNFVNNDEKRDLENHKLE